MSGQRAPRVGKGPAKPTMSASSPPALSSLSPDPAITIGGLETQPGRFAGPCTDARNVRAVGLFSFGGYRALYVDLKRVSTALCPR